MAVQSKSKAAAASPSSSLLPAHVRQALRGSLGKRAGLGLLLLLLLLLRSRILPLARPTTRSRRRRGAHLTDADLDAALEQLYIPHPDGTRELLVPHRGRISHVSIHPTKQKTFEAHYPHFAKQPPVAGSSGGSGSGSGGGGGGKQRKQGASATEAEQQRQEAHAIKAGGDLAAANAKKVGVNKEFFRQLR